MLLEVPNPKDPQDAEVAKMMLSRPVDFALTAQQWAIQYAGAPTKGLDLNLFQEMNKESKPLAEEVDLAYAIILNIIGGETDY